MKTVSVFIPSANTSFVYRIGENARDNFAVIDSSESAKDVWFHSDTESSCHVLGVVPEEVVMDKKVRYHFLKQGALLCKIHTPKLTKCKIVAIVHTEIGNVKKTPVDGQVVLDGASKIICV